MERTLQVIDYAVLVISAADGVQGHTQTLWRLLSRYRLPCFLFINKMDRSPGVEERLMAELKARLDGRCIRFSGKDTARRDEELAMCEEELLEHYLETGELSESRIPALIRERKAFPCFFGSALTMDGVSALIDAMDAYIIARKMPESFGARVYKISHDAKGARLTHLKLTGGCLKVKMTLPGLSEKDGEKDEKIDQIRIYSGESFRCVSELTAGRICAVTGLSGTYAGQGLGFEEEGRLPMLVPVLTYELRLPPECDPYRTFLQLRRLEEEEPQLHLMWQETLNEIHAQVMGEIQIEILQSLIKEQFGLEVTFGSGNIVYKETIAAPVLGCGHFEPLRHYAEVHLLLEPGERGSGLVFETSCSEEVLEKNWQRLVLTHLKERRHVGALTGSEITDMKITLLAGRAHNKHTEGGDFRQATYRAVRQGLRSAQGILLEPVYEFRLSIPQVSVGRAMTDIQKRFGHVTNHLTEGEMAVLEGTIPAATIRGYQSEVLAYTKGYGHLSCTMKGYEPCHNAEQVQEAIGYDADRDTINTADSVFCSHGAGETVSWQLAPSRMHVESGWRLKGTEQKPVRIPQARSAPARLMQENAAARSLREEKELEEIFIRTYGRREPQGKQPGAIQRERSYGEYEAERRSAAHRRPQPPQEEYLLVDGYNIIFAWEELRSLSETNMDAARGRLADMLSNYQGFRKNTVILVFDAYRVAGGVMSKEPYDNIHIVFTKEAETADSYIEKTVHAIGQRHRVFVATSDALEQVIILGQGAIRLSAADLKEELERARKGINEALEENRFGAGRVSSPVVSREKKQKLREALDVSISLEERMNRQ